LNRSAAQPAGALLCLDVLTGRQVWRYDVGDAVFGTPAAAGGRVYFGSRDRHCYALDQQKGGLVWKSDLGSPVVAAPLLRGSRLYAVASGGVAYGLDANAGAALWQFDVAKIHPDDAGATFHAPR